MTGLQQNSTLPRVNLLNSIEREYEQLVTTDSHATLIDVSTISPIFSSEADEKSSLFDFAHHDQSTRTADVAGTERMSFGHFGADATNWDALMMDDDEHEFETFEDLYFSPVDYARRQADQNSVSSGKTPWPMEVAPAPSQYADVLNVQSLEAHMMENPEHCTEVYRKLLLIEPRAEVIVGKFLDNAGLQMFESKHLSALCLTHCRILQGEHRANRWAFLFDQSVTKYAINFARAHNMDDGQKQEMILRVSSWLDLLTRRGINESKEAAAETFVVTAQKLNQQLRIILDAGKNFGKTQVRRQFLSVLAFMIRGTMAVWQELIRQIGDELAQVNGFRVFGETADLMVEFSLWFFDPEVLEVENVMATVKCGIKIIYEHLSPERRDDCLSQFYSLLEAFFNSNREQSALAALLNKVHIPYLFDLVVDAALGSPTFAVVSTHNDLRVVLVRDCSDAVFSRILDRVGNHVWENIVTTFERQFPDSLRAREIGLAMQPLRQAENPPDAPVVEDMDVDA